MGNAKKALDKIRDEKRSVNVTLSDVETALKAAGFVKRHGKGSHRIWVHADGRKQVLSAHGDKIPRYIVDQVRRNLS